MKMNQWKSMTAEEKKASLKDCTVEQLIEYNAMSKDKIHTYSTVHNYNKAMRAFVSSKLGLGEKTFLKKEVIFEVMRREGKDWFKTHKYTGKYPDSVLTPDKF